MSQSDTPAKVGSMEGLGSADLVAQMRGYEIDHEPHGWPAVQMRDISALCSEVERLRIEVNDGRMLRLLADLRWALGDRGKRMQDELVEFAGSLCKDAARYRKLAAAAKPRLRYVALYEVVPLQRIHWELPAIVAYGAVDGCTSFADAVDALP